MNEKKSPESPVCVCVFITIIFKFFNKNMYVVMYWGVFKKNLIVLD